MKMKDRGVSNLKVAYQTGYWLPTSKSESKLKQPKF